MRLLFSQIFLLNILFSQGAGGAIFLLISPSPTMNGMGEIGACLPSDDIYSSYYNPANGIGTFSNNRVSYSKMETQWLPNLADYLHLEYEVFGIGYRTRNYPLQFVLNLHKTYLDLGEQTMMGENPDDYIGMYEPYMKADAIQMGCKYSGVIKKVPIDVSFGVAGKTAIQYLYSTDFGSVKSEELHFDYGLLLSSSYLSTKMNTVIGEITTSLVPTFGYSVSNIADRITFTNLA